MSNLEKIRKILDEFFYNGKYLTMNRDEVIRVRKELDDLWYIVNGNDISIGMARVDIELLLGTGLMKIDQTWFYPAAYDHYYYSIEFENDQIIDTDFVELKIS